MGDHMPDTIFPPSDKFKANAIIDKQKYDEMYSESINNPDAFWSKHGLRIDWIKPYSKIKDVTYSKNKVDIKWFYDGTLNASANCFSELAYFFALAKYLKILGVKM